MKRKLSLHSVCALFMFLALGIGSCKKDKGDVEKPVITLNNPVIHQHYHQGDTIRFEGGITDNDRLKEVAVYLFKEGDNTNLWEVDYILEAATFTIDTLFIVATAETGIEYHFQVKATDKSGNVAMTDEGNHVHID